MVITVMVLTFTLEFLHKVWDRFSFAVRLWQNSLFIAITAVCTQNSPLKDLLNSPDIIYSFVLNINWVHKSKQCLQPISWNCLASFSTFRQSHSIDLDFSSWKAVEVSFFSDIFFLLWWSLLYELVWEFGNYSITSNPLCSSLWKNKKEKVLIPWQRKLD